MKNECFLDLVSNEAMLFGLDSEWFYLGETVVQGVAIRGVAGLPGDNHKGGEKIASTLELWCLLKDHNSWNLNFESIILMAFPKTNNNIFSVLSSQHSTNFRHTMSQGKRKEAIL